MKRDEEIHWICPSLAPLRHDQHQLLGFATRLWLESSLHRDWTVGLLGNMVWPAIATRQFLIGMNQNHIPICYVSWAKFDAASEQKYLRNPNMITTEDWTSGDRIWFIDWIAPHGHTRSIARKLEYDVFPDDVGHSIHVKKGRTTAKIYDHFGINASVEQKQKSVNQLSANLFALQGPEPPQSQLSQ